VTDRELLELAAKAAGINAKWFATNGCFMRTQSGQGLVRWNPLTDDRDALRLAVKIGMLDNFGCALYLADKDDTTTVFSAEGISMREDSFKDPYSATRRSIVRAAAEIGKRMK